MKKNILTIIILAMALINIVLSAVIIFVVVPTSNKTSNLIDNVLSIINLELEDPEPLAEELAVEDIVVHDFTDKLTINLKSSEGDSKNHYAQFNLSLSINSKHKDYETLGPTIITYENAISEIISEEFSKYTIDNMMENKNVIKEIVLGRIQNEIFKSNFIINVSFGKLILD